MNAEQIPAVGEVVHYVSYGTPGGEYSQACRAAIVTQVTPADAIAATPFDDVRPDTVGLAVLNPTGLFFNGSVPHDRGRPGPRVTDLCFGVGYDGGTWHRPENVVRPEPVGLRTAGG